MTNFRLDHREAPAIPLRKDEGLLSDPLLNDRDVARRIPTAGVGSIRLRLNTSPQLQFPTEVAPDDNTLETSNSPRQTPDLLACGQSLSAPTKDARCCRSKNTKREGVWTMPHAGGERESARTPASSAALGTEARGPSFICRGT